MLDADEHDFSRVTGKVCRCRVCVDMAAMRAARYKLSDKDVAALFNRAAAALETPKDLSEQDKRELIEDLVGAANLFNWNGDDDAG